MFSREEGNALPQDYRDMRYDELINQVVAQECRDQLPPANQPDVFFTQSLFQRPDQSGQVIAQGKCVRRGWFESSVPGDHIRNHCFVRPANPETDDFIVGLPTHDRGADPAIKGRITMVAIVRIRQRIQPFEVSARTGDKAIKRGCYVEDNAGHNALL